MSKDQKSNTDKPDLFFVMDIETNGTIPGVNSMLSIGTVVVTAAGEILHRFDSYTKLLPEPWPFVADPDTMEWWKGFPEAWREVNLDQQDPRKAMENFARFVRHVADAFHAKPVAACMPSWDFAFVLNYLGRHLGREGIELFGHRPLCIKTMTYALSPEAENFRSLRPPEEWSTVRHDHTALADAIGHAEALSHLLRARSYKKEDPK